MAKECSMNRLSFAVLSVAMTSLALAASGPAVSFTAKPKVVHDGAGYRLTFAVSQATDATAWVVDGQGHIVRHLAAGVLGKNAPAPFKADSLEQSILWDGKDDAGQPVTAAADSLKFHVALGDRAELERVVGWNGNRIGGNIMGLGVNKDGELFVLAAYGARGMSSMRVFSREGKYLRTVMPYPSTLPKERTAPFGQLEVDGQRLPIIYNGHGGNLLPMTNGVKRQSLAFHPKGHLVMVAGLGSMEEHRPPRHLLALAADGGVSKDASFVGPKLRKELGMLGGTGEASVRLLESVVLSPDGEQVYYATSSTFGKARCGPTGTLPCSASPSS
jgi:hypothetical protein